MNLKAAIIANAASLGYHWIYDPDILEEEAKHQTSMLFKQPNLEVYQRAKEAYFGYPNANVGALSMQGNVILWLYQAMKENPNFTVEDYETMLKTYLQPGGLYEGYVESYAMRLVLTSLNNDTLPHHSDDHLIGFVPYLVTKALDLPNDRAWSLAQMFTDNQDYLAFYRVFDRYFSLSSKRSHKQAMALAVELVPKRFKPVFKAALAMKETPAFVELYSLRACAYHQALPIVFHLAYHATSLEEALEKNILIGGNLSDRATYLAAMLSTVFDRPREWEKLVPLAKNL